MSEKYNGIYRVQSHLKHGWDYSSDGQYFLTIAIQNRRCILGEILDGEMILNAWGEIILSEWNKSFEIRRELSCDIFQIMPNHLHAIVTINNENFEVETHGRASLQRASLQRASLRRAYLRGTPAFERKPKSISSFIAGFKSACNTQIDNAIDRGINLYPELGKFNKQNHFWQPNYHDHIIRSAESYDKIFAYIAENPLKWTDDMYYDCGKIV